jgi:hypothetical protein
MVIREAKNAGKKVRSDLEFFNIHAKEMNYEYILPSGLIILNEDGPCSVTDSEVETISGINGSKILVGHSNTIKIKNHRSSYLKFRAIQFELETP